MKRFKSWSGFTAFAETEHFIHFGTDLDRGNGLVRADRALAGVPEFRAFPAPLDLQVREILDLGALGLLALCGMDADLGEQRAGRRAVLLLSRDEGTSWSVVHRFAADWSDAPEGLVPLGGARLVTVCTEQALVLEHRHERGFVGPRDRRQTLLTRKRALRYCARPRHDRAALLVAWSRRAGQQRSARRGPRAQRSTREPRCRRAGERRAEPGPRFLAVRRDAVREPRRGRAERRVRAGAARHARVARRAHSCEDGSLEVSLDPFHQVIRLPPPAHTLAFQIDAVDGAHRARLLDTELATDDPEDALSSPLGIDLRADQGEGVGAGGLHRAARALVGAACRRACRRSTRAGAIR
ncbi:MAG: hypothetical protein U1E76_19405 [Planctomycetota bacterium]